MYCLCFFSRILIIIDKKEKQILQKQMSEVWFSSANMNFGTYLL